MCVFTCGVAIRHNWTGFVRPIFIYVMLPRRRMSLFEQDGRRSARQRRRTAPIALGLFVGGWVCLVPASVETTAAQEVATPSDPAVRQVLDQYCIACHNARLRTADLVLDTADATRPEADPVLWEKVVAKLRAGSMPPPRRPPPRHRPHRRRSTRCLCQWRRRWRRVKTVDAQIPMGARRQSPRQAHQHSAQASRA